MSRARWLIVVASVIHIFIYIYSIPAHLTDLSWPPHARFHVLHALFFILGINAAAVFIVYFVREMKSWSLALLGVIFLMGHLSYYITVLLFPEGVTERVVAHFPLLVPLLLFAVGWGMLWTKEVRRAS